MNVRYLNTDLELESSNDLTPLVEAFGDDVLNLYNGKGRGHFLATFEIAERVECPNSTIQRFCMLAESLDDEKRQLWEACYKIIFDIGYEGSTHHTSYTHEISAETLKRAAALGASIRITLYPNDLPHVNC